MSTAPEMPTPDTPQVLLEHHLKALRLPTFLRERWPASAPRRRRTSHDTCCAFPSWSYWTASAAPPSAASARHGCPSSRASTASTSWPSHR